MKDIKYNNMYSIREDGTVWSKYRDFGLMKASVDNSGYKRIGLVIDGKKKKFLLHRLLAIHFIPNPDNLEYINHIDGNKLNNSLDNLEWCTASYNQKHAYSNGLKSIKGELNPKDILTEEEVVTIYKRLLGGEEGTTIADEYGVSRSCISSIKSKKNWGYLLKDLECYNFRKKTERLSEEVVHKICSLFQKGFKPTQVLNSLKDKHTSITLDQIYDLKRRRGFKDIVCNYSW